MAEVKHWGLGLGFTKKPQKNIRDHVPEADRTVVNLAPMMLLSSLSRRADPQLLGSV